MDVGSTPSISTTVRPVGFFHTEAGFFKQQADICKSAALGMFGFDNRCVGIEELLKCFKRQKQLVMTSSWVAA